MGLRRKRSARNGKRCGCAFKASPRWLHIGSRTRFAHAFRCPALKEKKAMAKAKETKKEQQGIVIPPLQMSAVQVRVEGISPLIAHQFPDKTRKELLSKAQKKSSKVRTAKDPEAEFNAARYRIDEHGKFIPAPNGKPLADAIPARYIKDAMVQASRFIEGMTMVETKQLAFVEPGKQGIPIQVKNGKGYKTYGLDIEPEIDESIQRVGRGAPGTGAPDVRFRPIYRNWSAEFNVVFNESLISADQIIALLNLGGFHCGVCEHRPSRGGENGQFRVIGGGTK